MRFLSRGERFCLTVRPAWQERVGPHATFHHGLRAKFYNHKFDSEKAQAAYGWTDEERALVEEALTSCAEFGVSVHLDQIIEQSQPQARKLRQRCTAFYEDPSGNAIQCPYYAEANSDFCATHLQMVVKPEEDEEDIPGWVREEAEEGGAVRQVG